MRRGDGGGERRGRRARGDCRLWSGVPTHSVLVSLNRELEPSNKTRNMVSYSEITTRFEQFLEDHATVRRAGFQDIFVEHQLRIDNFREAMDRKRLGVCAKVTIRIEQELVLTRQAFEAKLEIDNGDSIPMEDIKVRKKFCFSLLPHAAAGEDDDDFDFASST